MENNIDQAIVIMNKLIDSAADSARLYNLRSDFKSKKGDLEEAIKDVYKSLEIDGDFGPAYATLAMIHLQLCNKQDFYLHFEHALKLSSADVEMLLQNDPIHQPLFHEERFQLLLSKYNILTHTPQSSLDEPPF